MSVKSGLLAVDREALLRRAEAAGTLTRRTPALELSPSDAFAVYRGFDGLAWPVGPPAGVRMSDGLVDPAMLPLVRADLAARATSKTDVLLLTWMGESQVPELQPGWVHAGIDIGYYESEFSHYSIILNEVIFGIHDNLRAFGRILNGHLLLPSPEKAGAVLSARKELADRNADLEEVSDPQIVHVALPPGTDR